ncbi:MAG TPA: DUF192 domain-containing protein [Gemmatimonadaceae bacterium]|nr:DUF192 domain-containing protein [Gemmatimonadaceae bacterium]
MFLPRVFASMLVISLFCAACHEKTAADDDQGDQHVVTYDSTTIRLTTGRDTLPLRVQLAMSDTQHTMGLMQRHHLDENAGMLFAFDSTQSADAGFWMFRTLLPLDIAYIDSAGVIRAIRAMTPCTAMLIQGCPPYPPGVPYRYALEVNGGYFQRHNLGVGALVLIPDLSPFHRAK